MKTIFHTGIALSSLAFAISAQAAPTNDELWKIIQDQQKEIETLKKEQQDTEQKVEATADAIESGTGSKASELTEYTKIGGYGEHHLNINDDKDDMIDAHRFVLFIGHEFSQSIRFFSEFELEHGLAGEGKPGEVELEQAYVQWAFSNTHSLVAGQFLVPVGILNETHEPETFYGTERNLIENKIIPTTWWETGAMLQGELAPGLSYNLAWHSGLNNDSANIRAGRQKSASATANDWAYTGRIKYTGIAGLEVSASAQYQQDISQGEYDEAGATLIEAHAIYSQGAFTLRGLYASWSLDGDAAKTIGRDIQNGFYLEPSYKLNSKLGVFARYSEWNNTAGSAASNEATDLIEAGVNYWLHPQVVMKADYAKYDEDQGNDSLNIGLGWSF